jgi:hypothetical protein
VFFAIGKLVYDHLIKNRRRNLIVGRQILLGVGDEWYAAIVITGIVAAEAAVSQDAKDAAEVEAAATHFSEGPTMGRFVVPPLSITVKKNLKACANAVDSIVCCL